MSYPPPGYPQTSSTFQQQYASAPPRAVPQHGYPPQYPPYSGYSQPSYGQAYPHYTQPQYYVTTPQTAPPPQRYNNQQSDNNAGIQGFLGGLAACACLLCLCDMLR
eukprot:gene5445-8899_t